MYFTGGGYPSFMPRLSLKRQWILDIWYHLKQGYVFLASGRPEKLKCNTFISCRLDTRRQAGELKCCTRFHSVTEILHADWSKRMN